MGWAGWLALCLNVKVLVGAFNQERALVGAFSVIVKVRVIFGNLRLKLQWPVSPARV